MSSEFPVPCRVCANPIRNWLVMFKDGEEPICSFCFTNYIKEIKLRINKTPY